VLAQCCEVVDAVPWDVERDRRRDAGVTVHLGRVLEFLERIARDAGLREDGEARAGVAVGPRRGLHDLCVQGRGDGVDIHAPRVQLLGE
jgi:hypothetical protein